MTLSGALKGKLPLNTWQRLCPRSKFGYLILGILREGTQMIISVLNEEKDKLLFMSPKKITSQKNGNLYGDYIIPAFLSDGRGSI